MIRKITWKSRMFSAWELFTFRLMPSSWYDILAIVPSGILQVLEQSTLHGFKVPWRLLWQAPEESWKAQWPKCCDNDKDKGNSPNVNTRISCWKNVCIYKKKKKKKFHFSTKTTFYPVSISYSNSSDEFKVHNLRGYKI